MRDFAILLRRQLLLTPYLTQRDCCHLGGSRFVPERSLRPPTLSMVAELAELQHLVSLDLQLEHLEIKELQKDLGNKHEREAAGQPAT